MRNIAVPLLLAIQVFAASAQGDNRWKQIAVDSRMQHDGNSRVIEVDLGSIMHTADETSVLERETRMDVVGGGYSCREGDIRHGLIDKKVIATFCRSDLPHRYPGRHEPVWVTYETHNTNGQLSYRQYDSAGLYVINGDFVPVSWRDISVSVRRVSYDCRGYFRLGDKWIWLDATDKIAMVPRRYVSPERQVSNWVCAK